VLCAIPERPRMPIKEWPPLAIHRVTPEEAAAALQSLRAKHPRSTLLPTGATEKERRKLSDTVLSLISQGGLRGPKARAIF
jgi:hypothetical protein